MMDTETQQWSVQHAMDDAHPGQVTSISSVHFDQNGQPIATSRSGVNEQSAWKVWDVATGLFGAKVLF